MSRTAGRNITKQIRKRFIWPESRSYADFAKTHGSLKASITASKKAKGLISCFSLWRTEEALSIFNLFSFKTAQKWQLPPGRCFSTPGIRSLQNQSRASILIKPLPYSAYTHARRLLHDSGQADRTCCPEYSCRVHPGSDSGRLLWSRLCLSNDPSARCAL